jgi:hypothetical protein
MKVSENKGIARMMRVKKTVVLVCVVLALAGMAVAANVKCPIDDTFAYFTGKSQTIGTHLMYVYKCSQGHEFLVRQW